MILMGPCEELVERKSIWLVIYKEKGRANVVNENTFVEWISVKAFLCYCHKRSEKSNNASIFIVIIILIFTSYFFIFPGLSYSC